MSALDTIIGALPGLNNIALTDAEAASGAAVVGSTSTGFSVVQPGTSGTISLIIIGLIALLVIPELTKRR